MAVHPLPQVRGGGAGSQHGGIGLMSGWVSVSSPIVSYTSAEGIQTVNTCRLYFNEIHVTPARVINQKYPPPCAFPVRTEHSLPLSPRLKYVLSTFCIAPKDTIFH